MRLHCDTAPLVAHVLDVDGERSVLVPLGGSFGGSPTPQMWGVVADSIGVATKAVPLTGPVRPHRLLRRVRLPGLAALDADDPSLPELPEFARAMSARVQSAPAEPAPVGAADPYVDDFPFAA